jgi:hypothetical protein
MREAFMSPQHPDSFSAKGMTLLEIDRSEDSTA